MASLGNTSSSNSTQEGERDHESSQESDSESKSGCSPESPSCRLEIDTIELYLYEPEVVGSEHDPPASKADPDVKNAEIQTGKCRYRLLIVLHVIKSHFSHRKGCGNWSAILTPARVFMSRCCFNKILDDPTTVEIPCITEHQGF